MAKSRENDITILLGLKGCNIGEIWEQGDRVIVEVGVKRMHGRCKPREVVHSWGRGRKIYLKLERNRWKCRDCGRTFSEGRELVRPYSRLTRQAEGEALRQLKDRNFSQI